MEARHGDGAHEDGPRKVPLHVIREDALRKQARRVSYGCVSQPDGSDRQDLSILVGDDRSPAS